MGMSQPVDEKIEMMRVNNTKFYNASWIIQYLFSYWCMCVCVCVCQSVRRHIAKLRQEWFNGLSWNFVGMLGVTMPRMYQILVTNQLNLTN